MSEQTTDPAVTGGEPVIHSTRNADIGQTLFRFVQFSTPEPASGGGNAGITHPNPSLSHFLTPLDGASTPTAMHQAIESAVSSFTPYLGISVVKAENFSLYTFASWLQRNKAFLPWSEISQALQGVSGLEETSEVRLWDNLYYQALMNNAPLVRNAIIQVLQAHEFVSQFTGITEADYDAETQLQFEKLANIPLVLPAKLLARNSEPTGSWLKDTHGEGWMVELLETQAAQEQVDNWQAALNEVKATEQQYDKNYWAAQAEAHALHQQAVKQVYDQADPVTDPETGGISYPGLVLPEFSFTPEPAFTEDFLNAQLSPATRVYFESVRTPGMETFGEIIQAMEGAARRAELSRPQSANPAAFLRPPTPKVGMVLIPLAQKELASIQIAVFLPQGADVWVEKATFSLEAEGKTYWESQGKSSDTQGQVEFFRVFTHGIPAGIGATTFSLELQTNRGEKLTIATPLAEMPQSPIVLTPQLALETGDPKLPDPAALDRNLYGVKKLEIAEFKRVEQELCCYVEGEVSHIENVLAREYKERATRSFTRTEIVTEETREREAETQTDTTTTDRHELQSEVSSILNEENSLSYAASAGVSGGKSPAYQWNANSNLSGTNGSSTSNSFNQAEMYAKEVTEQALERVVERVSRRRTSTMLREFEDNNKHGFDNRRGNQHVVGIYRWVDKIYKNHLVNYGKRLMYSFMIPEPAKNYLHLMTPQTQTGFAGSPPVEPVHPNVFKRMFDAQGGLAIYHYNYHIWAQEYDVVIEPCPKPMLRLSKSFSHDIPGDGDPKSMVHGGKSFSFDIPEGYLCNRISYSAGVRRYGEKHDDKYEHTAAVLLIGNHEVVVKEATQLTPPPGSPGLPAGWTPIRACEHELPVSFQSVDASFFHLNLLTECKLKMEVYEQWQQQTYLAIMAGYHEKLKDYQDQKKQYDALVAQQTPGNTTQDMNSNPLENRAIEKRELKRAAIEMITAKLGHRMGQSHYGVTTCGPRIQQTVAMERHAELVDFMEKAFDWEIMAYLFHPYYWADPCQWEHLLNTTSKADYIFQAFLQSGMAKAVVPVKPGYEKQVLFYMDTGIVWTENAPVTLDELADLYASVLEGLEMTEETVEATWSVRVPTSLTIVQTNAGPLTANGLPCFSDLAAYEEFCTSGNPIGTGNNLLGGPEGDAGVSDPLDPCAEIAEERGSIMLLFEEQVNLYAQQGMAACADVLLELTAYIEGLEDLLILAQANGCDVAALGTDLATVKAEWNRISTECN